MIGLGSNKKFFNFKENLVILLIFALVTSWFLIAHGHPYSCLISSQSVDKEFQQTKFLCFSLILQFLLELSMTARLILVAAMLGSIKASERLFCYKCVSQTVIKFCWVLTWLIIESNNSASGHLRSCGPELQQWWGSDKPCIKPFGNTFDLSYRNYPKIWFSAFLIRYLLGMRDAARRMRDRVDKPRGSLFQGLLEW